MSKFYFIDKVTLVFCEYYPHHTMTEMGAHVQMKASYRKNDKNTSLDSNDCKYCMLKMEILIFPEWYSWFQLPKLTRFSETRKEQWPGICQLEKDSGAHIPGDNRIPASQKERPCWSPQAPQVHHRKAMPHIRASLDLGYPTCSRI